MTDSNCPHSPICLPRVLFPLAMVCSLAGFACLISGCTEKANSSVPKDAEASATKPVKTYVAQVRPMERNVVVTGSFNARERSTLSVKVPGRLETMSVDIGSVVKKGDVLAQIEKEDYELREKQALALLTQARVRLGLPPEGDYDEIEIEKTPTVQQAQAVLDEATKNKDRIEALTREKILAQAELDSAKAAHRVALGKYEDALQDVRERKALLVQRRAELSLARKQLVDSTIYAPFDGVVQQRRASPGEFLEMGTPLLVIAAVNPLRLQLQVPERESTHINVGQSIGITVGDDTNIYSAEISRVSPMLSESNRMLVIEADVPGVPALRPGLFAQASIVISSNDPALSIPTNAITSFVGLQKAFVVKEGKALEKSITTGRRKNGLVEVVAGLAPGDKVILDPAKLRSGQPVTEEADAKAR